MEYGLFTEPSGLVAGEYTLFLRPAGNRDPQSAFLSQPFRLGGGETLTVVLHGTPDAPRLLFHVEDTRPLTANQTRLTALNVMLDGTTVSLQQGTQSLFGDLASGTASASIVVPTVELRYNVRAQGQIIGSGVLQLRARQSYTFVIASNLADPTRAQVFTLNTNVAGVATVRVVSVADGISVDVFANAFKLVENFAYLYQSEPQRLPSGEVVVNVYAHGVDATTTAPLVSYQTAFLPDDDLTLILLGKRNELRLVPYRPDPRPVLEGNARMSFLNTLPDVPRVQLQTQASEPLRANYGQIAELGEVVAGMPFLMTWYELRNNQPVGEPLEFSQTFVPQAGEAYLYLVTGRGEREPFVLSKRVGVTLARSNPSAPPTPTPMLAPAVRGINAIDGITVDYRVDDIPFATGLIGRTSSALVTAPSGERTITVLNAQTGALLTRLTLTLEAGKQYAFVAFGTQDRGYRMIALDDAGVSPATDSLPTIRLVNLSEGSVFLGLGYENAVGRVFPDLSAAPEVNADGETVQSFRVSLPIGLRRLARNVTAPGDSSVLVAEVGVKDVYVLDDITTSVANVRPNVSLANGTHYDVIAYQLFGSLQVEAFVIPLARR
jgi:hypothetical protein